MTDVVVGCLKCGHCARLPESALPDNGVGADAPIASFVKRLTCVECGSRSVMAYRSEQERAETIQGRAPAT